MSRRGSMSAENERTVGATETKRIGQHVFQRHLAGVLGNVGEIAARAGLTRVDGGRPHLIGQRQYGENRLARSGRTERRPGGVGAIFSVLALRDQVAPPTINLDQPGKGCDLDYVPKLARQMPLEYVLSNSFGFGGTNGSLIFRRH